jgi:UDP-N-acetylmuramate dehydrogenase
MWMRFDMDVRENISLQQMHTFHMEVYARYFGIFSDEDGLNALLDFSRERQCISNLILGGGSNLLFTSNYDGLVLKNEWRGIEITHEDENFIYVKAGAGEPWHPFVMHCLEQGWNGLENLALIPGNVGASPMQNIGAYGVEIKDVFHSLEAFHLRERKRVIFSNSDCKFGYRESVFKNECKGEYVILTVTYRLKKQKDIKISYGAISHELEKMKVSDPAPLQVAQAVMNIRRSKLPNPDVCGNAGSFFKNPEISSLQFEALRQRFPKMVAYALSDGRMKLAAGWLIEQSGWKGVRQGDAGCHEAQALVLVNYGKATGKEIVHLAQQIKTDVLQKFEVQLQEEVNIL